MEFEIPESLANVLLGMIESDSQLARRLNEHGVCHGKRVVPSRLPWQTPCSFRRRASCESDSIMPSSTVASDSGISNSMLCLLRPAACCTRLAACVHASPKKGLSSRAGMPLSHHGG